MHAVLFDCVFVLHDEKQDGNRDGDENRHRTRNFRNRQPNVGNGSAVLVLLIGKRHVLFALRRYGRKPDLAHDGPAFRRSYEAQEFPGQRTDFRPGDGECECDAAPSFPHVRSRFTDMAGLGVKAVSHRRPQSMTKANLFLTT